MQRERKHPQVISHMAGTSTSSSIIFPAINLHGDSQPCLMKTAKLRPRSFMGPPFGSGTEPSFLRLTVFTGVHR